MYAQTPTVGLLQCDQQGRQQEGYVLFSPINNTTTYLIDKCGRQVHTWNSTYKPGLSVYLLPDGSILRTGNLGNQVFQLGGGTGGIIEKIGWDGAVLWSYQISSPTSCQHHDILPLPNGNVLAIVWDAIPSEQALAAGRNPAKTGAMVWSEKIIEIAPDGANSGTIVWEWNAWNHLVQDFDQTKSNAGVVADHPELINANYITNPNPINPDWIHFNSIDYNPELNQIIVSAYTFGEVWVIDHSTTKAEAATHSGGKSGKGGDLLYRWGNPSAYNRGIASDRILYGQHNALWIPKGLTDEGKIMVFNNGLNRPNSAQFSSVDIIAPPIDAIGNYMIETNSPYLPSTFDWRYTDDVPSNFYSASHSSAQRLANGNTLICAGTSGLAFEITPDKKTVWKYKNPITITGTAKQGDAVAVSTNIVFRYHQFLADFSGFTGRLLPTGVPIELQPGEPLCKFESVEHNDNEIKNLVIYPNPVSQVLEVKLGEKLQNATEIMLINTLGQIIYSRIVRPEVKLYSLELQDIPAGMYALKIVSNSTAVIEKVMIVK
jgi:hypothetical protein